MARRPPSREYWSRRSISAEESVVGFDIKVTPGSTAKLRPFEKGRSLIQRSQIRFFSSCMFRPRPRISLVKTSKLAGVPASRVFSPLTIDS
jgi:hypothetical protein